MVFEFKFPDVGEGIQEGTVVKLLVKEGDYVKEDKTLFEVETAKAVVEIPSPVTGYIRKIHFKEGDIIKVNSVIVTFDDGGGKAVVEETKKPAEKTKTKKEKSIEAKEVHEIIKEESKESTIQKPTSRKEVVEEIESDAVVHTTGKVLASPAIRKLAVEQGINLEDVTGTGENGIITKEDVLGFKKGAVSKEEKKAHSVKVDKETDTFTPRKEFSGEVSKSSEGREEIIEVKGIRKEIVRKMNLAAKIPVAFHFDEFNVNQLKALRAREKKRAWSEGIQLTFLPFVVKAVCLAMRNNEMINSTMSEDETKITVKKYYNMGIAVDTNEGLKVVVIRDADKKSILQIGREINELSEKARNKTASLKELTGSTFTITNIGSIGGRYGGAILNYPEAAILSLGRMYSRLIKEDDAIKEAFFFPLGLTFDHRIIDGADAARFMNEVGLYLTDPELMILE